MLSLIIQIIFLIFCSVSLLMDVQELLKNLGIIKNGRIVLKPVQLTCPKCNKNFVFKNFWFWVWHSPFHSLVWDKKTKRIRDYRLTKCPYCSKKCWVKSNKY